MVPYMMLENFSQYQGIQSLLLNFLILNPQLYQLSNSISAPTAVSWVLFHQLIVFQVLCYFHDHLATWGIILILMMMVMMTTFQGTWICLCSASKRQTGVYGFLSLILFHSHIYGSLNSWIVETGSWDSLVFLCFCDAQCDPLVSHFLGDQQECLGRLSGLVMPVMMMLLMLLMLMAIIREWSRIFLGFSAFLYQLWIWAFAWGEKEFGQVIERHFQRRMMTVCWNVKVTEEILNWLLLTLAFYALKIEKGLLCLPLGSSWWREKHTHKTHSLENG